MRRKSPRFRGLQRGWAELHPNLGTMARPADARWAGAKGLDHGALSVEDGITTEMRTTRASIVCLAALALFCLPMLAKKTQDAAPPSKTTMDQTARITIEVSGGEKSVPVENASVYIKYVEERKVKKDKTVELNVKTNRDGTAHVPGRTTWAGAGSGGGRRMENVWPLV